MRGDCRLQPINVVVDKRCALAQSDQVGEQHQLLTSTGEHVVKKKNFARRSLPLQLWPTPIDRRLQGV
jgi:hypothetical protein